MLGHRHVIPDRIRPLKRVEYDALVERGLFADERIELLLGSLVEMRPQGPVHAEVVRRLARRLFRDLPADVHTSVQSPLALSDDSEPEPDLAVVAAGDYSAAHPDHAYLVIEVAESSIQKDRGIKTGLYAAAGIPEFWLVNLIDRTVEVYTRPAAGRYGVADTLDITGILISERFPDLRIPVREILP